MLPDFSALSVADVGVGVELLPGFKRKASAVRKDEAGAKRAKKAAAATAALNRLVDFCFENPFDGLFKRLTAVQTLLQKHTEGVRLSETSYCKYDFKYRKNTLFLSTLLHFDPAPRCARGLLCAPLQNKHQLGEPVVHDERATGTTSVGQRNSIPPDLVIELVDAWKLQNPDATTFLFIDVFTGWGSVEETIKATYSDVYVCTNDINKQPLFELDMRHWTLESLLTFALTWLKNRGVYIDLESDKGAFALAKQHNIAVLFHLSTPCETYSCIGLRAHRDAGQPITEAAKQADQMNTRLIQELEKHVFHSSQPSSLPPAQSRFAAGASL